MLQLFIYHFENGSHMLDHFSEIDVLDGIPYERLVSFEEAETRIDENIEVKHCYVEDNSVATLGAKLTDAGRTAGGVFYASYIPD